MNIQKIQIFHFGDCGEMDSFNPFYALEKQMAKEILYNISYSDKYSLAVEDLAGPLGMEQNICKSTIDALVKCGLVSEVESKYKVNFTVFLERDLTLLEAFLQSIATVVGDKVISLERELKEILQGMNNYSEKDINRLFYHSIGDHTFDGTALDYFGVKDIFTISKQQPGQRDYILVGYQDSDTLNKFSNSLLCSSNNFCSGKYTFNSFGDCNGSRNDMFRFLKRLEKHIVKTTEKESLNFSYNSLNKYQNSKLVQDCGTFIEKIDNDKSVNINEISDHETKLLNFLLELSYLEIDRNDDLILCKIPLFYKEDIIIFDKVSSIILNAITDDIKNQFEDLSSKLSEITPAKHCIDFMDVGNELWHLVFGFTNEYLVSKGFFPTLKHREGEGRYSQALYIS